MENFNRVLTILMFCIVVLSYQGLIYISDKVDKIEVLVTKLVDR